MTPPVYVGRTRGLQARFFFERGAELNDETSNPQSEQPKKPLTPAAERALAEAEARRAAQKPLDPPKEIQGRNGPEPVRYGDWEIKGLASDF